MINKGTWKTPIEAVYCVMCGKPFIRYKNSTKTWKYRSGKNMDRVRNYNSRCCSKICSRRFNYKDSYQRRKILEGEE